MRRSSGVMEPRVVVVARSASFEAVWPELVGSVAGVLEVGAGVGEVAALRDACAVVVAVGGVEEEAVGVVGEVRACGVREVAVVGAGAVVVSSIPPFAVAVGVPARVLRFRGQSRA